HAPPWQTPGKSQHLPPQQGWSEKQQVPPQQVTPGSQQVPSQQVASGSQQVPASGPPQQLPAAASQQVTPDRASGSGQAQTVLPARMQFEQALTHLPKALPPPGLIPQARQNAAQLPEGSASPRLPSPKAERTSPPTPVASARSASRREALCAMRFD